MPLGNNKGFTLIELLIVVAIIGILAAIAVPNFMNARVRAFVARTEADLRSLATAMESYRLDNNMYPPTPVTGAQVRIARLAKLTSPVAYMSSVPLDPLFKDPEQDYAEARAYPFWDPETTDDYKVSRKYFQAIPEESTRRGRWTLLGAAPDGIYLVEPFGVMEYNPSNGVISSGDVVKMGP
ncbi:MAG TPA: prepilin-type N-terminal cleavage/methylation domain-containing protein [bacterium]|nr:prepilin-type N-terminal cleavage/methylation domain-containing protein [bacterium]